MRRLIITGASGLVGTELIHALLGEGGWEIVAVSGHVGLLAERYSGEPRVTCVTLEGLKDELSGRPAAATVHLAWSRSSTGLGVASSLDYLERVLALAKGGILGTFIYMSSQGVYGQGRKPFWPESLPPAPGYPYAVGKYAGEVLVRSVLQQAKVPFTCVRLSAICENVRFMNVFAKNALASDPITVQGGGQLCAFMDVRDAASGLVAMLERLEEIDLAPIYNLGRQEQRTILDIANDTARLANERFGSDARVEVAPSDAVLDVGMDCSLFKEDFGWEAAFTYEDMVLSLLDLNSGGGRSLMPYSFEIVYLVEKRTSFRKWNGRLDS